MIKRIVLLMRVIVICCLTLTAAYGEAACDVDTLAASVVRLAVYDENGGSLGTGSGFALGDPAVLVTAAHVIVNMDHMVAWRDDGTSFRIEQALDADTDADVAICLLPEDTGLIPLPVASDAIQRGEDVLVISSQFGLTNLVSKGTLCGFWDTDIVKPLLRVQALALLALPLILWPRQKRTREPFRWAGYLVYPGHLLLLWIAQLLMGITTMEKSMQLLFPG